MTDTFYIYTEWDYEGGGFSGKFNSLEELQSADLSEFKKGDTVYIFRVSNNTIYHYGVYEPLSLVTMEYGIKVYPEDEQTEVWP